MIRAFCEVFDDCSLWNATPFDLMLVGTRQAAAVVRWPACLGVEPADFSRRTPRSGFRAARADGSDIPRRCRLPEGAHDGGCAAHRRLPEAALLFQAGASLSNPRFDADPDAVERFRRVLDPGRARQAFGSSPVGSPFLAGFTGGGQTMPFFDQQRSRSIVLLWEVLKSLAEHRRAPLRLLTQTSSRRLALWMLGS